MIRELEQADALSLDDQRLARRHARTALAISDLHTMILLFYFEGGYMVADGATLALMLGGVWAGHLLLSLLVFSGRFRRCRDPSLSLPWNLWLTTSMMASVYFMDEFRIS